MTIALAVFTDGRDDLLDRTLASYLDMVTGPVTHMVIHDDTGDLEHREHLAHTWRGFDVLGADHRRGFGGAIKATWHHLAGLPVDHVLHLEDDFTFNRPVNLSDLARILRLHPHLAQLALRRQPWNPEEEAVGGIVEQHPGDYTDHVDGNDAWLEHRRFFTTNPSLYRRKLCERGWPDVDRSEGMFSLDLFCDPDVTCGFWGHRTDGPWVHHIGTERVGTGY